MDSRIKTKIYSKNYLKQAVMERYDQPYPECTLHMKKKRICYLWIIVIFLTETF